MMSSFSGKIKEFPQISVDRFDGRNLASTAYFLSHAHSDHMVGLSSPQFLDHLESNSGVYLYCSQITARFLQASIRHRPLSPYVFPLQHEESVKITVPNVAEEATHQLWVTLIPAAHCPGSVMFLFEGRGGTVLYTGDFRISVGEVARIHPLHNADGTVKLIDSLLIDTTFCHKDIIHFPTRDESAQAVGEAVEDWLAKGNNFLIHLVCPAKYGYEFIYRSLHDRFGMKIHVSRWIYCMYDTVPEIQDVLTLDATVTWIHACTFRIKNGDETTERSPNRQLPCRCVPFGVNNTPNIRVIKPSALFYTFYQSAKEIMQISNDGTFCRVLLSTHASCSEVLDMVSYLRPRKVFPNVIPSNSTKDQVLKLLHEALNRSGDHYSIEYGGSQRTSLGSFKRQLNSSDSTCSGNTSSSILDAGLLDVYLSSPNKRRRHSDSNMTLILPTPRGNMKGSLSLEGETRHEGKNEESQPCTSVSLEKSTRFSISDSVQGEEELEWRDPYTPSPTKSQHFFHSSPETCLMEATRQNSSAKDDLSVDLPALSNAETSTSRKTSLNVNGMEDFLSRRKSTNDMELEETSSKCGLRAQESHDSVELSSVFSEDGDRDSIFDPFDSRPSSCAPLSDESPIKQSRKLWYKHKYFSTPVHDEVEKVLKFDVKSCIGPRSSSLPLPEHCRDDLLSPEFSTSVDGDRNLPLITVSSPSDQASESQVSDETNVTVVLSSGEPSDSDLLFSDELPVDNSTNADNNNRANNNNTHSVRPSVICSPPKPDVNELVKWDASESKHCTGTESMNRNADTGWIDCNKLKHRKTFSVETQRTKVQIGHVPKMYRVNVSKSNTFVARNNEESDMSPEFVDLVSDSDCSPEFIEKSLSQTQKEAPSIIPSSSRSSCLKTVRRTHDHVEVVSLDHHPL